MGLRAWGWEHGSAGRSVWMRAQQWEHLDMSVGDRITGRSDNSHTPIPMFSSQKHHHTTTEIQQHSKHDDGSVGMRGGDGSMGQEHGDRSMGMGA